MDSELISLLLTVFFTLIAIIIFVHHIWSTYRTKPIVDKWPFPQPSREYEEVCRRLAKMDELLEKLSEQQDSVVSNLKERLLEMEEDFADFKDGYDITQEFKAVKKALVSGEPVVFVHGGAGVGKSTLIKWLCKKQLIDLKLAPTGLAALNIGGMTIHKFFGFRPLDVFPKRQPPDPIPRDHKNVLHHAKTICIDEVSMVRADLMDAIDRTLRAVGSSSVPFGGYQILLVGDLYQLPPVVKTNNDTIRELFNSTDPSPQRQGWSSPWFLDADVFAERKPMRIRLTKVFRQQDAKFVEILNDIRIYRNLQDDISFLNRCITVTDNSVPRRNNVTLVLRNDTAKKINDEKICQIASAPMLFHAIREGSFAACDVKDLPVEPDITLKKGTFVMIVYNDPNGAFVNGTTGIIQDLDPQYADVRLKNSNVVRISMYTWDSYKIVWDSKLKRFENMRDGSFTQIPLIPAYAITCHKAQGKTLDNVYLDFDGNAFASGQTYVALSRTRSLSDISASRAIVMGDFPINRRLMYFQEHGSI